MRRFLLMLFAATVLSALLLPASALASGWAVKNGAGTRIGKVVRTQTKTCVIYDRGGRRCGKVTWSRTNNNYYAIKSYLGSDIKFPEKWANILDAGDYQYRWYIESQTTSGNDGVVYKRSRWVVAGWMNTPSGRIGSVALKCPGWAAAGAVFVLSKRFK